MLDFDTIKLVLIVAIAGSIITTAIIQKIKEGVKTKKYLWIISLGVSLIFGTLFALSFSDLSFVNCLWVGGITWIGADATFKMFEDKIFKSFSSMDKTITISKENETGVEE